MSVLRVYCSFREPPQRCTWAWIEDREPICQKGTLAELPRHAGRVQLIVPAADVLITRARLPKAARRRAGSILAFAVEEELLGEPDENQVIWLGMAADADVLAVLNRQALRRWIDALDSIGIRKYEIHCETLLLPWVPGQWGLAWNGNEGFVRTSELEGAATDCGDAHSPPLSLRLMLDEANARNARPDSIAIYATATDAKVDVPKWQEALGVPLRHAGAWSWDAAPADPGMRLMQARRPWRVSDAMFARLRPAAWIAGAALAIHTVALVTDWALLTVHERRLRQQMESRFRAVFPDAVSVVDPALQMRRKVAEARHAAGQPDTSDFLAMIGPAASAMKDLPAGSVRVVSYENGRIVLELAATDESKLESTRARLVQSGLQIDTASPASHTSGKVVMVVRSP
jgi:general secretion pathway protein L